MLIQRQLALVKFSGNEEGRIEARRVSAQFRARIVNTVDSTVHSYIFEIVGTPEKLESYIALMRELGLVELTRTEVIAMSEGENAR